MYLHSDGTPLTQSIQDALSALAIPILTLFDYASYHAWIDETGLGARRMLKPY